MTQVESNWNYQTTTPDAPKPSWWSRMRWPNWVPPPDWTLSFLVHATLLVVLASISISSTQEIYPSLILAEQPGAGSDDLNMSDGLENFEINTAQLELQDFSNEPDFAVQALQPMADLDTSALQTVVGAAADRAIASLPSSSMTAGRSGQAKLALLSKYGGTAKTEAAVQLGLEWLLKQQYKDGTWSYVGPYSDGARFGQNHMAATAMSLLAFLGAGHTHKSGPYQKEIRSALEWMVAQQKSDGNLGENTPRNHAIYTHAIATFVLSEAYAMTDDSWLRQYVERGVRYTVRAQGTEGGWRYEYHGDSDTSVTGWCMMALVSAQSAGIDVGANALRRINSWLNSVDHEERSLYSYTRGRSPTPSMTAEGLLCRMYLGWPRTYPAIDKAIAWLKENGAFRIETREYYYWYYATQVLHHVGGRPWNEWNEVMREALPGIQVKEGAEKGSFPPSERGTDGTGGRLYATCMSLYCLEVYYRHLPLYSTEGQSY